MNKAKFIGKVMNITNMDKCVKLVLEIIDSREIAHDTRLVTVCAFEPLKSKVEAVINSGDMCKVEGHMSSGKILVLNGDTEFKGYVVNAEEIDSISEEEVSELTSHEKLYSFDDYMNRAVVSGKIISIKQCGNFSNVLNVLLQDKSNRWTISICDTVKDSFMERYGLGDTILVKCLYASRKDRKGYLWRDLRAEFYSED